MKPGDEYNPDLCLAYKVLDEPDAYLGVPSTAYLRSYLSGAEMRRLIVDPEFCYARIVGVLGDPNFSQQFVDATNHPKLTIAYASALQFTDFSLADGFAKLRQAAIGWHRRYGWANVENEPAQRDDRLLEEFWENLVKRTAMYTGGADGWSLFCFLNGMTQGGDWLGLDEVPGLSDAFDKIQGRSRKHYGTGFAAFRFCSTGELLGWAGLPGID
ncbi:MAG: hypothetical protein AAGB29_04840 [Planctomycetota bacterium]